MGSLEAFQEQFCRLKEVEEGKDQLIQNLIVRVKELEDGLAEKKLDLERERLTSKLFQSKFSVVNDTVKKLEGNIASNSFVSVLIDGDCMTFFNGIVKSAQQGGLDAVRRLRSKVCEYVSEELKLPSNIEVRIRIFANFKGLATVYCSNKVLNSPGDFHMFIRGFNMGYPMCDFVDAGDGKECADSKLKVWFNRDMADVQCEAVLFGGSADNGYARLLLPYVADKSKSKRVVLVEGPPFAKELAVLKDQFHTACFPDIFRDTKLPTGHSMSPPLSPVTTATSYAATITSHVDADAATVRIDEASRPSVVRKAYPVLLNSKGQRLDAIITPRQGVVNVMRGTKHCNMFHLLGQCPYANCSFLHGKRLGEREIEARRLISRRSPCPARLGCRDEKCLRGHECPDRGMCAKIGTGCTFIKEMHNVDRT